MSSSASYRFRFIPLVSCLCLASCGDGNHPAGQASTTKPPQVQSSLQSGTPSSSVEPAPTAKSTAKTSASTSAVAGAKKKLALRPLEEMDWLKGQENSAPGEVKAALMLAGTWDTHRTEFYRWWGTKDPAVALKDALETNPGASTACSGAALAGWFRADQAAALAWVSKQPENAESVFQAGHLIREIAPENAAEMSAWVDSFTSYPGSIGIKASFIEIWRGHDASAAANWVINQEGDSKEPSPLMDRMITDWVVADPQPCSEYLRTLNSGEIKDKAITAFVQAIANEDAESALAWTKTIENATLQEKSLALIESITKRKEIH